MKATQIPRKFEFKIGNQNHILNDPNPSLTAEDVKVFYSGQYPELTNAEVINKGFNDDSLVFQFKTAFGTKG